MQTDQGIETLLDLNGNIVQQENGYWVEIHVWRVVSSSEMPHGVRYALTLHEQSGKRIMGYDNAHAVKHSKKFKYAGQVLPYDHKHRHIADKGVPYEFMDAYQLLSDFFADVDQILKETKNEKHHDRYHASRQNSRAALRHRQGRIQTKTK